MHEGFSGITPTLVVAAASVLLVERKEHHAWDRNCQDQQCIDMVVRLFLQSDPAIAILYFCPVQISDFSKHRSFTLIPKATAHT